MTIKHMITDKLKTAARIALALALAPVWIPVYLYTCAKSYEDDIHD